MMRRLVSFLAIVLTAFAFVSTVAATIFTHNVLILARK